MARGASPSCASARRCSRPCTIELRDDVAEAFQEDIADRAGERRAPAWSSTSAALDMVDTYVARVLAETGRMAKLMGTETVSWGCAPTWPPR